jgi:hypothetical protein
MERGGAGIVEGFKFYDDRGRRLNLADLPGRQALAGVEEPEVIVSYTSDKDKHQSRRWTAIKAMPVFDAGSVRLAVNVLNDVTQP